MLQTVNRRDMGMYVQRTITVLLVVYVFDCMADTFRPRLDMPKDLPMQIHNARKALQLIEQGQQLSVVVFCVAATVVSMCSITVDGLLHLNVHMYNWLMTGNLWLV